jgi:hypothetical protein
MEGAETMYASKAKLQALNLAENAVDENPLGTIAFPWPTQLNHTVIETVAPSRHNRLVYRGDDD